MCYIGKATKIFIFLVTVLIITGILLGFGVLRRAIHPHSHHQCSGYDDCSQSDSFFPAPPPLPPQLEFPIPSSPDLTPPPQSPPSKAPPPPASRNLAPPTPPVASFAPPPPVITKPPAVGNVAPPPPPVIVVAPPPTVDPPPSGVPVTPGLVTPAKSS